MMTHKGASQKGIVQVRKPRTRQKKAKGLPQPKSLVQFFSQSPLAKTAIDLERKPDYGSAVKL